MRKQLVIGITMVALFAAGTVQAEGRGAPLGVGTEKWRAMSDEEKRNFHQERKAKWQKMSDAEKVQLIEKHRKERMNKMDAQWNAMDDTAKVRFVEERMKKQGKPSRAMGFQQ